MPNQKSARGHIFANSGGQIFASGHVPKMCPGRFLAQSSPVFGTEYTTSRLGWVHLGRTCMHAPLHSEHFPDADIPGPPVPAHVRTGRHRNSSGMPSACSFPAHGGRISARAHLRYLSRIGLLEARLQPKAARLAHQATPSHAHFTPASHDVQARIRGSFLTSHMHIAPWHGALMRLWGLVSQTNRRAIRATLGAPWQVVRLWGLVSQTNRWIRATLGSGRAAAGPARPVCTGGWGQAPGLGRQLEGNLDQDVH